MKNNVILGNLLAYGVFGFLLDLRSEVCLLNESVSNAAMIDFLNYTPQNIDAKGKNPPEMWKG